jgi:hypothetical protein
MQTIKPTATINIQKKALKKMFLSVEIVKEMSEYPEYDDHNSTLDPKKPFRPSKVSKFRQSSPPQQLMYQKKPLRKMFLLVEIVKDTGKYLGNHDHNG